jgi:hypothetical protein
MRSPIGPFLVVLGLASTLVIVLLLIQVIGLRGDLDRARDEVRALETRVESQEPGVTAAELRRELDDLRTWTRDVLAAEIADRPGGDVGTPAGGQEVSGAALLRRLDLVLERITALDDRVDDICRSVPVC